MRAMPEFSLLLKNNPFRGCAKLRDDGQDDAAAKDR
jgi:hypothetical protein